MAIVEKSNPHVSIVTVYYNRGRHVDASIQSLLRQDYNNFSIVAVDDGSTDDTLERLNSISDNRLQVLSKKNTGFTSSMNYAIGKANGELIAIHGSGDTSHPSRIRKQVACLQDNLSYGVVGCHMEIEHWLRDRSSMLVAPEKKGRLSEVVFGDYIFGHGEVMFRRECFEQVGGYREVFKYAQDRDLWVRMSRITDYGIVPEVLYKRRSLPGGVSNSCEKKLLQAYYSDFAVFCGKNLDEEGKDPVDRFGNSALLLRSKSKHLARRLCQYAITSCRNRQPDEGMMFADAAISEFPSLSARAVKILCRVSKSELFGEMLVLPMIEQISRLKKAFLEIQFS